MRVSFKSASYVLFVLFESFQGKIMNSTELQMRRDECLWQAYFLTSLGLSFLVHCFVEFQCLQDHFGSHLVCIDPAEQVKRTKSLGAP